PEVTVAHPLQKTVTIFIEENGETEVVEQADVRARVRGILEEINFAPGQTVQQDDVLYVIQRSEYQAALNSAKAALAAAEAAIEVANAQTGVVEVELTRAETDFQRHKEMLAKEAVTQSQFDTVLATRDGVRARREAAIAATAAANADRDRAQANLDQAQLDFDYTLVKAPISGRITKTEIKQGNLVENGSLMATIVGRDQMYANFNVSDREVLRLQKAAQERGEPRNPEKDRYRDMPAYLRRELDEGFPFVGKLDYVDQEGVDQSTGTFAIRAIFENPDNLILPGLFVRVRVPVGKLDDALLIPEQSLSRDQRGTYVLVVNEERKVDRRTVTPGQTEEGMVVIETGLTGDELVLIEGGQRARPGVEVSPTEINLTMPDESESVQSEAASPADEPGESSESAEATPTEDQP
ncbi:MAG: efflux RND transporter periplasmic adaptor subunit, partial [Planctomycetaceae bacterium]|nr:efflux RND transporter periplasmic adaptor subunit [Planctomycetaceae bacterium]